MFNEIFAMIMNANTQWVLFSTMLLGLTSGVLGSFALLRKQSLLGDAMSHAALPGICIAFILSGEKHVGWLLIGAALAGILSTYVIEMIIKHSRLKEDTSIGLVLSVFFGFGIVLLTFISRSKGGNQSGLNDFIFGQAASLIGKDLKVIITIAIIMLMIVFILFKEFKILTFDYDFAKGIGLPTGVLNMLLMTLIVCAVVIGLQAVGVVLMSAMLITPAISARYWTEKLSTMVIIAGVIGAFSGALGTLLSALAKGMPTGPMIIIAATLIFIFSLMFAPKRGLLFKCIRLKKVRKQIFMDNILVSLYELSEKAIKNNEIPTGFGVSNIQKERYISKVKLLRYLKALKKKGIVVKQSDHTWMLTNKGVSIAYEATLNCRMFEIFHMYEMKFGEVSLSYESCWNYKEMKNELVQELRNLLKCHGREPIYIGHDYIKSMICSQTFQKENLKSGGEVKV